MPDYLLCHLKPDFTIKIYTQKKYGVIHLSCIFTEISSGKFEVDKVLKTDEIENTK